MDAGKAAGGQPLRQFLCGSAGWKLDRERYNQPRRCAPHACRFACCAAPRGIYFTLGRPGGEVVARIDRRTPHQLRVNGLRRVMLHGQRGGLVEQLRSAGVQQLDMVVELRHGAYRGATGAHGVGLVDGNGRRHALYFVHRRFVHAVHELASIGREGFHITALAFSV